MGLFRLFRRRNRAKRLFRHGDVVRITGHITVGGADGFDLRGDQVTGVGANHTYQSTGTGERMTCVQDRGGAVFAVPSKLLGKPLNV